MRHISEMTVKELRQYARDNGLGIRYIGERKKKELIQLIVLAQQRRLK